VRKTLGCLAAALVLASAAPAPAQNIKPAVDEKPAVQDQQAGRVYRIEIFNGPVRSVHYVAPGASPSEELALRELARAGNEIELVDQLQALRMQYVIDEQALEARRRAVQSVLYGQAIQSSSFGAYAMGAAYGPGYYSYPYYGAGAVAPYFQYGSSVSVLQNAALGVGDEGCIKGALAPVLARQASPEYAVQAYQAYNASLSNAVALLNRGRAPGVPAVGPEIIKPRVATVTLKGGEKIEGRLLREDPEWVVVDTGMEEVRVRPSEVVRITFKNPK
jgi:hypothetical protein